MDKKIHRTNYISEIDKFIKDFEEHREDAQCASRQAEIKKHQRIFDRRDNPIEEEKDIFDNLK